MKTKNNEVSMHYEQFYVGRRHSAKRVDEWEARSAFLYDTRGLKK